jgi:hypothetical protein
MISDGRSRVRDALQPATGPPPYPAAARPIVSCGLSGGRPRATRWGELARAMVSKWLTRREGAAGAPQGRDTETPRGASRSMGRETLTPRNESQASIRIDPPFVTTCAIISRGAWRPSCASGPPSNQMEGAGKAGRWPRPWPACEKNAGGRYHRSGRTRPALPAQRLERLIRGLPGAPGLLATMRATRIKHVTRDTSIGVSGPHDFAVRNEPFVGATPGHAAIPCAHRIPPPTSRDGRDTPLRRKQDGKIYT